MTDREIARLVLGKLMAIHEGGGESDHLTLDTWERPQGVALYGMVKVYQMTRDPQTLQDIRAWYVRHLNKGLPTRNINTTAPMLTLTLLYEETRDESFRPLIEDWSEWIMNELPPDAGRGLPVHHDA